MGMKNHTRQVAFGLRIEHDQMVRWLVAHTGMTRSQVVQDAIEAYFTANGGQLTQAPDAHLEAQYDDKSELGE